MKIFQSLQKFMSVIGVQSPDRTNKLLLNLKSFIAFVFIAKYAILPMVGLWLEVKTFSEYAEAVCVIMTSISALAVLVEILFNSEKIFAHINNFESMIQKRKFICDAVGRVP